jgi:TPR repeat protein
VCLHLPVRPRALIAVRRLQHGLGAPRDLSKAVHFYQLAAAQNDCDAQYNLACALEAGVGGTCDIDHAVRLYHCAAERGHCSALYDLGYIYQHGLHVRPDYAAAVRYYQRAADLGHPIACNNLAYMCGHTARRRHAGCCAHPPQVSARARRSSLRF